jgi:dGTPase
MQHRPDLERLESETLAPYAAHSAETRGRDHACIPCPLRTDYQRDRDRVIHCAAFRKLEYKTQVYVIHEGDYYRTRLTHTMEVAQIARTLARALGLNGDLTEAVALAHDMGHTPFGHSGEVALHRLLKDHGGFEHNRQGIRIVELLESKFPEYPGLNLTWEVREGIAKHNTSYDTPALPERFEPDLAPPLEAQLVDVADEIAYNHHDLDDALKMGILRRQDLDEVPWLAEILRGIEAVLGKDPRDFDTIGRSRLISALIDGAVNDALSETDRNIAAARVGSLDDVRRAGRRLAAFSPETAARNKVLREFLFSRVYRHPHVVRMMIKAERFIEQLFELYRASPGLLPSHYLDRVASDSLQRAIGDYISGMTDRYCIDEYKRAFLP